MISKHVILQILQKKLSIKKVGTNYFSLCPFHLEKTPSCSFNLEKMVFYCFGCGASGSVFKLLNTKKILQKKKIQKKKNIHMQYKKKDLKLTSVIMEYFKYNLYRNNTEIYTYLKRRKMTCFEHFIFSLGCVYNALKIFYLTKVQQNYYKNIIHTYTTRIIIPLKNTYNFVLGFSGRMTTDMTPKYLHTKNSKLLQKKKLLYGLHIAKEHEKTKKSIFVVEGFFDVISLHSKKIYNAVAILGTHISAEQINTLTLLSKKILLYYDNDLAGDKANKSSIKKFKEKKKNVHVVKLPKHYDPDNFIKNYSSHFLM